MAKKKNTRICSNCIEEYDVSKMYSALVPNRDYYTCYCETCIKEMGIKGEPFIKPRKTRKKTK